MNMPEALIIILVFTSGLVAGFLLLHLISRGRIREMKNLLESRENQVDNSNAELRELSGNLHAAEVSADRVPGLESQVRELNLELTGAAERAAGLSARLEEFARSGKEKGAQLENKFKALAADALASNNKAFLDLAGQNLGKHHESAGKDLEKRQQAIAELVLPLREQLKKYEHQMHEMENLRQKAYGELTGQVRSLNESQQALAGETRQLVQALRSPQTRGRWGETTLKRTVELAGMVEYCDFFEQETAMTDEGQRLRPDMLIRLPSGRLIIIDAKTPLDAYLDHFEETDPDRQKQHLLRYAAAVRSHMDSLTTKAYQSQFDSTPDFVVMFIPGESFLAAAAGVEADLFEHGFRNHVILATPATLISLLRTVALGWQQETLAENARMISQLGTELYDRLTTMGGYLSRLGNSLSGSVDQFNKTIRSLETRVLPAARRFPQLGVQSDKHEKLQEIPLVTSLPTPLSAPELTTAGELGPSPEDS
jgi:DNA recombination protein RmuC